MSQQVHDALFQGVPFEEISGHGSADGLRQGRGVRGIGRRPTEGEHPGRGQVRGPGQLLEGGPRNLDGQFVDARGQVAAERLVHVTQDALAGGERFPAAAVVEVAGTPQDEIGHHTLGGVLSDVPVVTLNQVRSTADPGQLQSRQVQVQLDALECRIPQCPRAQANEGTRIVLLPQRDPAFVRDACGSEAGQAVRAARGSDAPGPVLREGFDEDLAHGGNVTRLV